MTIVLIFLSWLITAFEPAGIAPGEKIPPCAFYTTEGNLLHTDSLKGNVLLIDVWASWNQASRIHNQQLIKLYEKYRTLNFRRKGQIHFISVSMDSRRDLWLIARSKDNLHWPYNCCDYKGWDSETINQLKINIIPANYLVDHKGIVVARNIWGFQLDSALKTMNKEVPN